MKFEHSLTSNWENAFRGLRHPYESYARSDSHFIMMYATERLSYLQNCAMRFFQTAQAKSDTHFTTLAEVTKLYEKNATIQLNADVAECAFIGYNDLELAQKMIKAGSPNDKFLRQIFVSVDVTGPMHW